MNGDAPRTGGVATWIAIEPDPVLAFLHAPAELNVSSTAVLFLARLVGRRWRPIAGAERGRKLWWRGFPAARIDLPGTGDSGGSPQNQDGWTHGHTLCRALRHG